MYFRLAAQLLSCCLSGLCHLIQYIHSVVVVSKGAAGSLKHGACVCMWYVLLQSPESRLDTFLSETFVLMQAHV